MRWYKISEGKCPDEYVEIILSHNKKYSKEEFFSLIEQIAPIGPRRAWELSKILVKKFGFKILPVEYQYHFKD